MPHICHESINATHLCMRAVHLYLHHSTLNPKPSTHANRQEALHMSRCRV